jgi:predicted TPR repeat methyltransferase
MPVSTASHLSYCLEAIIPMMPGSVLDLGCGYGTWGFLLRTHLDVFYGRIAPHEWRTRIVGVELFEPYIQAHQRHLYSEIRIADIRDVAEEDEPFDVIIAGDVIEHLDKADGERVVERMYARAQRALVVNIPLGPNWEHPEEYGNPGELHRSVWEPPDFLQYPGVQQIYDAGFGHYGVFVLEKPADVDERCTALMAAAEYRMSQGEPAKAEAFLRQAAELKPADHDIAMLLADVLLRNGQRGEAVAVFDGLLRRDPGFLRGHLLLAQTRALAGERGEAMAGLDALLARDNLDPELRRDAEAWRSRLSP